jgi:hypothetical protein
LHCDATAYARQSVFHLLFFICDFEIWRWASVRAPLKLTFMRTRIPIVAVLIVGWVAGFTSSAESQSLGAGLSKLLTDQTPPPPGYVRDQVAADATFATVASLLQVELTSVPVASSSGGFVYRFSPTFGTVERASDSFGPFFSERALRNGRGHLSVGFAYQYASYTSLQGADLTAGTFPTNTARFANQIQPFSVDTLSLELNQTTVTGFASYGLTDKLDVGVAVPVTSLHFSGRRVNTFNGQSTVQSVQSGSATGVGDITINARYQLMGGTGTGVAVGADLRPPTGRQEDLLGAGKTAWRVLGVASWEHGPLAAHANGGFGFGGVSREQFLTGAVTLAAGLKLTLIGELIGRRLSDLYTVADVYEPHPVLAGVDTMRWLPAESGVGTAFLVTGVKWNLVGNWLLNSHVLTRLTDTGLRARFTPSVSLDYALGL